MFSKQLEYSYLMYMYLKENPTRYVFADEIIEKTNVPNRWGRILLGNLANKKIIISKKGKGFSSCECDISFWKFYAAVEDSSKLEKNLNNPKITSDIEKKYQNILLGIGIKVQYEMMNIKI